MAQVLPMTLSGDNLGQRHRYFNAQVNQAVTDVVLFQNIEELPEEGPVDRLFKIDVANKLHNVDYILKNIKHDDMLYVSRALKCKWLLDRRDIINPNYLEDVLYPEMVIPAISKMKNYLYVHLRDPITCREFYEYYKTTKFQYAVKFLSQCDNEFLLNEFPKIMTKLTPHNLKVLGQKCPQLVKVYYDSMATDNDLVKRYLSEEKIFYNNIKRLLKLEPDMFLDIIEKYHGLTLNIRLSPSATEYILRFHKSRFMAKPELYVARLLHMRTVARCLNEDECQEVVLMLARADYLTLWFTYEKVEPLVKRLSPDRRAAFKKRVFEDKDVGEHVAHWPYALPTSPVPLDNNFKTYNIFEDCEFSPVATTMVRIKNKKKLISRNIGRRGKCAVISSEECSANVELQKSLNFNKFRFMGFEGTLYELEKLIRTTSVSDHRRDILLVLVSKSGGRVEAVRMLLELALSLDNESVHDRATIVRNLVKQANVWRLPQDVWDTMLLYARGLGLDGTTPEVECREGLHAAVMRQLIATGNCEQTLRDAFLNDFTTFTEYELESIERKKIGHGLQNILVAAASDAESEEAENYIYQLFDVLEKYDIPLESSPAAVSAVTALAERDFEASTPFLARLYNARIGRREMLRHYLKIQYDDAALLNALRHDPAAVSPQWLVELISTGKTRANKFLLKLAVYFSEKGGLVEVIRPLLLESIAQQPVMELARPLAALAGGNMCTIMQDLDVTVGERTKLAAALRANMHLARPAPDALALGWRKTGMKAIAWRAMRCRPAQVTQLAQSLLEEKVKQTVRLALILAQRTACAADMFATAIKIRPLAALRASLIYFRALSDRADLRIWDLVKSLIPDVDVTSREGLRHMLSNVHHMPPAIKPDYCAILYLLLDRTYPSSSTSHKVLYDLMRLFPKVSNNMIESVLYEMLEKLNIEQPELLPAIFIRYLMLSENDSELNARLNKFGEPLLNKLDHFREDELTSMYRYDVFFSACYHQIIRSLHYNFAFFNRKYKYCSVVIERVLTWMQTFMPREEYFGDYFKIHASMLFYKAVRQSLEDDPEVFEDPVKSKREGVKIIGFTLGRHIAKETTELISKYFDSVIEIYRDSLVLDFFDQYFKFGHCTDKFTEAVVKGILSEGVSKATRMAVYLWDRYHYDTNYPLREELEEVIMKSEDKETQFYLHAAF